MKLQRNLALIRKAAHIYSVGRSNIQCWVKQEKELKTAVGNKRGKKKNTCRMTSSIKYPEMEVLSEQWITDQRSKGIAIIGTHIKKKATFKRHNAIDQLAE